MTAQTITAHYCLAETLIASDIELHDLDRVDGATSHLRVHLGGELPDALRETMAGWQFNKFGFASGLDDQQRVVLTWAKVGTVIFGADAHEVLVHPDAGAHRGQLSHFVVNHALPRLFWQRGRTVFHATSVVIDGKGVGFVAPAGTGKSTLAASFAMAGCPLLSDDCLVLDYVGSGWEIVPSYSSSRLLPDSMRGLAIDENDAGEHSGGKRSVRFEHGRAARYPLVALIVLERADGPVVIDAIAPADAFWALGQRAFITGDDRRAFEALTDVADRVPVWSLRYPPSFEMLDEVRAIVRSIVGGG
jgi:hypothetical protein